MNRLISVQKKSASCLHWNQFWYLKNSLICIQIIIIKYVSITILPATTVRKVGTILTFFGWMGYPMQIKINFLCRDSILAAPLCLDLVLLSDLAARAGRFSASSVS